jgi:hypothetical protein
MESEMEANTILIKIVAEKRRKLGLGELASDLETGRLDKLATEGLTVYDFFIENNLIRKATINHYIVGIYLIKRINFNIDNSIRGDIHNGSKLTRGSRHAECSIELDDLISRSMGNFSAKISTGFSSSFPLFGIHPLLFLPARQGRTLRVIWNGGGKVLLLVILDVPTVKDVLQ